MKTLKNINFGFVFQLVAILSLTIVYIIQWGLMITDPSLRTGTDFMAFYSAGRVAQEYGITNTYYVSLQQEIQEEVVGFSLAEEQILIYIHPPYLIPILVWIVSENYIASFMIWAVLMFSCYLLATRLLVKTIQVQENKLIIFIAIILFFPFFQSLLLGQDTAILFLGVVLWIKGMNQKNDWVAAIGLALTSIRPHLCLVFIISFFFYNYRASWKSIFTTGILTLISIVVIGWDGALDFISIIQISASGSGYGTNENAMFNLIGLISRSLPFIDKNFIRILGWVGYIASILFLWFIWTKKEKSLSWLISLTIILALFFAPHLHYHDLTLLIIPLTFLSIGNRFGSNILLAVSLILLIFQPLYYVLPYFLYGSLVWRLWKSSRFF